MKVLGDNGIDVHLLRGDEYMTLGQVMAAGAAVLDGTCPAVRGSLLPPGPAGPGLRVEERPCAAPRQPTLEVTTAAFEVRAHHDLLDLHGLFGLTAARDARRGHFAGISRRAPGRRGSARQSVLARFDALGFEAAAVTAVAAAPGAAPPTPRYPSTVVTATFEPPLRLPRRTPGRHGSRRPRGGWPNRGDSFARNISSPKETPFGGRYSF
jgi:hypothetical protein